MTIHNPNCDGGNCRSETGEVRLYPLGGGANLILCEPCFAHENVYRKRRVRETGRPDDWPQVDWQSAKPYPDERRRPVVIGTSYFVSRETAIRYYRDYGFDADGVDDKIAGGEIHIGEPPLKGNQRLRIIDDGARYATIEE